MVVKPTQRASCQKLSRPSRNLRLLIVNIKRQEKQINTIKFSVKYDPAVNAQMEALLNK